MSVGHCATSCKWSMYGACIPDDQVQVRRAREVTNDGVSHSCRLVSADNVIVSTALRCYFHVLRYSNQRRPSQQRIEWLSEQVRALCRRITGILQTRSVTDRTKRRTLESERLLVLSLRLALDETNLVKHSSSFSEFSKQGIVKRS